MSGSGRSVVLKGPVFTLTGEFWIYVAETDLWAGLPGQKKIKRSILDINSFLEGQIFFKNLSIVAQIFENWSQDTFIFFVNIQ